MKRVFVLEIEEEDIVCELDLRNFHGEFLRLQMNSINQSRDYSTIVERERERRWCVRERERGWDPLILNNYIFFLFFKKKR